MIETDLCDSRLVAFATEWAEGVMDRRPWNEVIERHGSPYIERWFLGRKVMVPTAVASRSRVAAVGPEADDPTPLPSEIENLYLHRYLRNDFEDQHCHPWPNGSLVVRGGIVEQVGVARYTLLPGDVVFRPANQRHAIIEVEPGTITLFGTGQKEREWGFWPLINGVPTFVHHTAYRQWKIDNGLELAGGGK